MQDSLPAGWLTFAGRELNPLDRDERFPSRYILFPLSWIYPDAMITELEGPPSSPVQLRIAVWTRDARDTRPMSEGGGTAQNDKS
jgi:hypothetical protein